MSWTILQDNDKETTPAIECLNRVISDARREKKNIPLMFCAASDDGVTRASSIVEYPYSLDSDIFRIGAAKDTGEKWPDVSNTDKLHFLFPGVDIPRLIDQLDASV